MIKFKSEIANYSNIEITVTATMPYYCWKSVCEHLPADSQFTEKLREVMSGLTKVIASETEAGQWEAKPPVNPVGWKFGGMAQAEAAKLALAAWGPDARAWIIDSRLPDGLRVGIQKEGSTLGRVLGYGGTWEEACEMAGLIVKEKQ